MSKLRRWARTCFALLVFYTLAACGTFQPSMDPRPQPVSLTVVTTDPQILQPSLPQDPLGAFVANLPSVTEPILQGTPTAQTDARLVHALAERFNKPETLIQRVVAAATRFARDSFPMRNSILAIIAVESGFNPNASYKGSKGLMQIQLASHRKDLKGRNPFNIEVNVAVGTEILAGYYDQLNGKQRSAVLAYNAGIGSFLKKRYKVAYYEKYRKELTFIRSITS